MANALGSLLKILVTEKGKLFGKKYTVLQIQLKRSENLGFVFAEPQEIPSGFEIDESTLNATSAVFTWNAVDDDATKMQGRLRGYDVSVVVLYNQGRIFCANYFIELWEDFWMFCRRGFVCCLLKKSTSVVTFISFDNTFQYS